MSAHTDRELLELAGKAAGRQIRWDGNVAVLMDFEPGVDDCSAWDPLVDDGDALRLAARLRINIEYSNHFVQASPRGHGHLADMRGVRKDVYEPTRRAIVTAAAAMGSEA